MSPHLHSSHVTPITSAHRFDPANEDKYRKLCQDLSAEEGAEQDDDVMLEGGQNIELNTTCPITALSVRIL